MSVKIRLSRGGAKKRPYYYIVAANSTSPRDGRYIEQVGTFNPMLKKDDENRLKLNLDRCKYWLSVGALPTDRVARFLDAAGLFKRTQPNNPIKGKPGKKRLEREAAAAEKAKEAAEKPAEAEAARPETPAEVEAPPVETPAESEGEAKPEGDQKAE